MSEMFDADEFGGFYEPPEEKKEKKVKGYSSSEAIFRDMWKLAAIVEGEYPKGNDEWLLATSVFAKLNQMKWGGR